MTLFARTTCLGLLLCGLILNSGLSAGEPQRDLIAGLKPVASILSGREASFSLQGDLQIPIDGSRQPVDMQLSRYDATSFDLQLSHPEYAVTLRRRADVTVLDRKSTRLNSSH